MKNTTKTLGEYKMSYEIEKNVPVPPRNKAFEYPVEEMSCGDSFFTSDMDAPASIRNYCNRRKNGITIMSRKETKNRVEGRRIWRVK